MKKTELLAPAGSLEALYAAYAAGADAVYIGGSMFGARAYAQNPNSTELLDAIDYAHIHRKKLYLTVNTLLKEHELKHMLFDFLDPLYEQGLDAVIVQDFGVMSSIKRRYADMHIHASTQMTATGCHTAAMLEQMGVSRVVLPRELSFEEIKQIREITSLEIECFVHGALCYCYSGQCLFSSIAGGRSGNRGRCAQPCRMAYTVSKEQKCILNESKGYILSPKDINTIELLPQIIEAGVNSLKIEGRMKKPEYTAGVVSIYRKYLDMYYKNGEKGYSVEEADKKHLFDLFNRKGFSEGYYRQHNGKTMITFTAPELRREDEVYQSFLRKNYIGKKLKEKIKGNLSFIKDKPSIMTVELGSISVCVMSEPVMEAKNNPFTADALEKRMTKTGGTEFNFEKLDIETDGESFLPVVRVNELRRTALEQLTEAALRPYRRRLGMAETNSSSEAAMSVNVCGSVQTLAEEKEPEWMASVQTRAQLDELLSADFINTIILDSHICSFSEYERLARDVHEAGKSCLLRLPLMFRQENEAVWKKNAHAVIDAHFDKIAAGLPETLLFAQEILKAKSLVAESGLYAWNTPAQEMLRELGCDVLMLPVELNASELAAIAGCDTRLGVYGRLPMMISAQCIKKNTLGCDKKMCELMLTDRKRHHFPVMNYCAECFNVIYNDCPLSLADEWKTVRRLKAGGYRLDFTTENAGEMRFVLELFADIAKNGRTEKKLKERTRGHFMRGIE